MRGIWSWLAIGMLGTVVPAAAETIIFHNCSDTTFNLKSYNEGDRFCWVSRQTVTLSRCGTVTLDCIGQCQINGLHGFSLRGGVCGGMMSFGGHPFVITKTPNYFTDPQSLDYARGSPEWDEFCACSEAEMQW